MADEKKKEEEQEQAAPQAVVLPNGLIETQADSVSTTTKNPSTTTTTKGPSTSVTTREPQTTNRTEKTVYGIHNPDGSVNHAAVESFNKNYRDPLARAYGIDPETGQYVGRVSDLFDFDPKIREEEERRKEELARFKQKESGWKSALGVITDIVTAGHGGNVWVRPEDKVAENAKKDADTAHENITAIANAVPRAKQAIQQQYEKAVADRLAKYAKDNSYKISQSVTSGGGSKTENSGSVTTARTTGGGSTTRTQKDVILKDPTYSGNGGGGGGKNGNKILVVTTDNDDPAKATHNVYDLTPRQHEAILRTLIKIYNEKLSDPVNGQANREGMIRSGILKAKGSGLNATYELDEKQIMGGGKFYGITPAEEKLINEAAGTHLKFTQPKNDEPTFGTVETQEQEEEFDD